LWVPDHADALVDHQRLGVHADAHAGPAQGDGLVAAAADVMRGHVLAQLVRRLAPPAARAGAAAGIRPRAARPPLRRRCTRRAVPRLRAPAAIVQVDRRRRGKRLELVDVETESRR
jgi:hypothetical protein